MKRILLITSIIVFKFTFSAAQTIPNAGFENWDTGKDGEFLTEWNATEVAKTSDAREGNFAAALYKYQNPLKDNLTFSHSSMSINFPTSRMPGYLTGYIKTSPTPGDSLTIVVAFYVANIENPEVRISLKSKVHRPNYTHFFIPITYPQNFRPRNCFIQVFGENISDTLRLDNFTFSNTPDGEPFTGSELSVRSSLASSAKSLSIHFNEETSQLAAFYKQAKPARYTARLIDAFGNSFVLNNLQISAAEGSAVIHLPRLSAGVYSLVLRSQDQQELLKGRFSVR